MATTDKLGLTELDHRFLAVVKRLEREKKPLDYRAVCKLMGWKSVNSVWQAVERCIAAGFMVRGERLALMPMPITTPKARQLRAA